MCWLDCEWVHSHSAAGIHLIMQPDKSLYIITCIVIHVLIVVTFAYCEPLQVSTPSVAGERQDRPLPMLPEVNLPATHPALATKPLPMLTSTRCTLSDAELLEHLFQRFKGGGCRLAAPECHNESPTPWSDAGPCPEARSEPTCPDPLKRKGGISPPSAS